MNRELMKTFLAEHARGAVQPSTLTALAQWFETELQPKRRGRPRKGARGLSGDLRSRLNTSKRTHWELHKRIAEGLTSGLSWGKVMASVGSKSEFDLTRDGIRRALEIFDLGSAAEFRAKALPSHVKFAAALMKARPTIQMLQRVDFSDLPDDMPLSEVLRIVRARDVAEKK